MKKILILIVIAISFGTILPLFHEGLFPMHDNTQVARVLTMSKALSDGLFPVRWVDYLGYGFGYPIFNFYAPFAYYVAGIFSLIGLSAVDATKVMMGLGMLSAGVSMYLLSTSLFNKKAGSIMTVFYLYAPYHALDLYVRGAIGELWAYALLPLPFFGLWRLYQTQKFRYVIIVALSFGAIILSHNLTAMMVSPFLLASALILMIKSPHKKFSSYFFVLSLLLGGLLSSFYALPALLEISSTNVSSVLGGGSNPLDHFVCLPQLWQSGWGFGGSVPGCLDGMSFMLGKLHILVGLLGILSAIYFFKKKDYQHFSIILAATAVLILSVFFTLDISQFIWKNISVMKYFQFPWRFLVLASLSLSVLVGGIIFVLDKINKLLSTVVIVVLVIICFVYYGKYFKEQYFITDTTHYTSLATISYETSKISDEYMPKDFVKPSAQILTPKNILQPISGKIVITQVNEKTQEKKIILSSTNATVKLNLAYFPAWKIKVDNVPINPSVIRSLYIFPLTNGSHVVTATFVQTPLEKLANILSLVGFCICVLGIIKARRADTL